ncbi:MAG: type II toxin-antitoxin system VapC family toxin [Planctomycetaceae bacterium]|nr:type II toxin-antitoxin system VapC family toxin [Planctomycetaceae bacterium]
MPALVLDSSATLSLAFEDERDDQTVRIFEAVRAEGAIVPGLWPLEVANILYSGVKRNRLVEGQALRFLRLLSTLPISVVADESAPATMAFDIFVISSRFGLTAYDAAYLQLALVSGLPLASKDRQLNAAAKSAGLALY